MSKQEILNAAIARLRSSALESYAIIKGITHKVPEEGDADKIAAAVLKLAQFEGAMITLQKYTEDLLVPEESPSEPPEAPAEEENPPEPPHVVTPEQSPTLRRSLENPEAPRDD